MTDVTSAPAAAHSPLTAHLLPAEAQHLAASGNLPAALRQAVHTRLGSELAALAAFLPAPILRQQLASPSPGRVHGARWHGSILFADLSGFTALSATLSTLGKQGAEAISAIINDLFGTLVAELEAAHGSVLKFGGDAITAFFAAEELGEAHAHWAASAALAMQARMAAFAQLSTRAGTFALRLRIGVHSGEVFAAQVGDQSHIELVVSGREVNRVALAQEIAEPGQVVISETTRALVGGAVTAERQGGFYLLSSLEATSGLMRPRPVELAGLVEEPAGAVPRLETLMHLAQQIAALRPYLPNDLPRRFLAAGSEEDVGEFRPVTVMFAHFYPFSAALELLEGQAERAAAVLNAYYQRAQAVIQHYGGIVNKVDMYTYGDKLMALFGAPSAHEDDPQRAVRAAFDLHPALDAANAEIIDLLRPAAGTQIALDPQFLKQRIGINTGVVFAGLVGSARRHEYTVMGQHVNLAARLMAAAEEDTTIVAPGTRKAVARHIALRTLAPVALKGIPDPVPIAQALHPLASARQTRGEIQRPALVGRDVELGQVLAEAQAALHGRGRVVALVGDAGTGKTRLIEEALQHLVIRSGPGGEVPPFDPYSVECQSYEQRTPYALFRDLLRQFLQISSSDLPGTLARRVAALVPELVRFTPLLGDILGLALQESPLTSALTPQQRHDRAQELVEALLLAQAQRQPLVLICDDLHWADASSLELLTRLARQARHAALLLLLGYRLDPPPPEPWAELAHCLRLPIRELPPPETTALVRALLRSEPPPALAALVEKAQGNPFFVEEVVHSLVESGALVRSGESWRLEEVAEAVVPDSIEGVITARLDRLEERSREVLQVAAVVGRRFAYPVLSGVVARRATLPEQLGQLSEADLILAEPIERDLAYLFKHALTRDVAYEAILYARRRELHRRVAERIEELHPKRLDEQLALLARHYLLAEAWGPAFAYHLRAGRQAQARYANHEAIALYEVALQLAPFVEPSGQEQRIENKEQKDSQEPRTKNQEPPRRDSDSRFVVLGSPEVVELHERLGWVRALIGEYDPALVHYQSALELLRAQPDAPIGGLMRIHRHIARIYELRADYDTAFEWLERAIAQATDAVHDELARCYLLGAGIYQRQGRYSEALEWAWRGLRVAEQQRQQRDMAHAYYLICGTYMRLGQHPAAVEMGEKSLALYKEIGVFAGQSDAQNTLANVLVELGRNTEAADYYRAALQLKDVLGDVYGQAVIANNLGNLLRKIGDYVGAMEQFAKALHQFELLGSQYGVAVLHMNIGSVSLSQGNLDGTQYHLDRSRQLFVETGSEEFLAELYRYYAELALSREHYAEALAYADQSLALAQRLDARAEAGATQHTRGLILHALDRYAEALATLQEACTIFTEVGNRHELTKCLADLARLTTGDETAVGMRTV